MAHTTRVPISPDQTMVTYYVKCRDEPWWNVMTSDVPITFTIATSSITIATAILPLINATTMATSVIDAFAPSFPVGTSDEMLHALIRQLIALLAEIHRVLERWRAL